MKRFVRIVFIIIAVSSRLHAQSIVNDSLLQSGISALRNGENDRASAAFRSVLIDESLAPFHPEALYWLIKIDMAQERYDEAYASVDRFLAFHPADERVGEVRYHQARLMYFQGEPEKAIIALGRFIVENPQSSLVSSAHYWIGEALVSIGRLEEADAVFSNLIDTYPYSVKREAARYRRSEISLLYRERELLDLLHWSHEEYLQNAEDFYRREKEYRNALESYRERFGDDNRTGQLRLYTRRLLAAKERLLDMRNDYVDELLELYYAY